MSPAHPQARPDRPPDEVVAPSLWRDRRALGWVFATGVSLVGDEIWFVALAFTAVQLGDPKLAGLVLACATVPRALLTILGGALTDRVDARRMMLIADVARIAVLAGALVVLAAAGVSAGLLIAVGLLFGVAEAFYVPASSAFPRQLVARGELVRMSALRQLMDRIASVLGAPLGGILLLVWGLSGAMAANLLSFVLVLGVLLVVKPRRTLARASGGSVRADMGDGFRYLRATPRVRDLVITLSGLNVFVSPVVAIGLALHVSQRGWGAVGLGWLTGAIGVGAAVGTLGALRRRPERPLRAAILLLFVQAAALGVVGTAGYGVSLAGMFVLGVVAGLASPMLSGAFQATVDEEYVGRVSSVLSLTDDALAPVAIAGFGLLAGTVGLGTTAIGFGAAFAALLLFALSRPHVRNLRLDDDPAPDASSDTAVPDPRDDVGPGAAAVSTPHDGTALDPVAAGAHGDPAPRATTGPSPDEPATPGARRVLEPVVADGERPGARTHRTEPRDDSARDDLQERTRS
ncbi:MFS transporter [Actinosynnema sp. NPDC020468]|uniref:MFS transporter n=1 Tax=Actinosynnema sp. NPDC020468 TaxID=3154488 RepID=UPI00340113B0